MQTKFDIVTVVASLAERIITLKLSREVDEQSISSDVIALSEKASRRVVPCTYEVAGSVVTMRLLEWPVPNSEYVLLVQKDVKSVLGETLPASLQRNITFNSALTSEITILSPVMFEQLAVATLIWRETGDGVCNKFYVEIATDASFSNICRNSAVEDQTELVLGGLADGQYYCRVRAQQEAEYGRWSQIVSFLIKATAGDSTHPDPVFIKALKLAASTADNTTPAAYVFTFNADLISSPAPTAIVSKKSSFATETIAVNTVVSGRTITVTSVLPAGFEDNSTYEFQLVDVAAAGYEGANPWTIVKTSRLTPMYTDAQGVYDLMQGWTVDINTMLRNIHEASKYADYITASTINETSVSFPVSQFVKYRAAKTALLALYMQRAAGMGRSGVIGEVEFKEDNDLPGLTGLMKTIDEELKVWQEAVRGYKNEGRNKPQSAIKSQKMGNTTRQDTFSGGTDRSVW